MVPCKEIVTGMCMDFTEEFLKELRRSRLNIIGVRRLTKIRTINDTEKKVPG